MEGVGQAAGVREGDVLAGKYRIEKVLGVGGMGVVVAARHLQLDTRVAIKLLLPEMLANADIVGRFAREARAAVKITGEHVARVLDVGTLETGAPFMVMEFLDGVDLHAWLQQRGALAVDQAVEFVLQACVAVAEAHSLGIVHRDLKPANLFCIRRADGKATIKVLDFGISKITDVSPSDGPMSVTRTNALMGSPLYMSPEQMRSAKDADAQSDVWALGVILYELLTGRVPFDGDTVAQVAINVATTSPAPLRQLRADVPLRLDAVVLHALEKSRERRYRSVAELAVALRDFAPAAARPLVDRVCGILRSPGTPSIEPRYAPPPPSASPTTAAGTMSAVGRTTVGPTRRRRRIPSVLVSIGAALGAGALAVAVVAVRGRPAGRESTGSAASAAPAIGAPATATTPSPAARPSSGPWDDFASAAVSARGSVAPPADRAASPDDLAAKGAPAALQRPPPKRVPSRPAASRPASAKLVPAAPSSPATATPPATVAPAAAPARHENQLDLGSFQ